MNENERIDNPQVKIVKCVGTKAQDEKMRWNSTKVNGRNFWYTKFSIIVFALPTEEIFQVHGQKRPVANLLAADLYFSREKCHYQSHWVCNFQFFFPYFDSLPLLGKFERHCL